MVNHQSSNGSWFPCTLPLKIYKKSGWQGKKDNQKQMTFTKPMFLKVKLLLSIFLQALKWRYQLTHPKENAFENNIVWFVTGNSESSEISEKRCAL